MGVAGLRKPGGHQTPAQGGWRVVRYQCRVCGWSRTRAVLDGTTGALCYGCELQGKRTVIPIDPHA